MAKDLGKKTAKGYVLFVVRQYDDDTYRAEHLLNSDVNVLF